MPCAPWGTHGGTGMGQRWVVMPGTIRAIAAVDDSVATRVFGSSDAVALGGWPGATTRGLAGTPQRCSTRASLGRSELEQPAARNPAANSPEYTTASDRNGKRMT